MLEALCWKEDKGTCNGKCTRIHDIGLDMYDVCVWLATVGGHVVVLDLGVAVAA